MRKISIILSILCLLAGISYGSTLYRIRFGHYPEKIRAVFDFDGAFTYETNDPNGKIIIRFKDAKAGEEIKNYVELNDLIVRYFEIEKEGKDLKVTIPLAEPIDYNIFYLNDPPRLVIDFGREFLNIVSGGTVAEGIEYLKVKKGFQDGQSRASVLRIDLKKAEIKPSLAQKQRPTIVDSFINLILPWTRKESEKQHFSLNSVSSIVKQNQAVAGINGTFYALNGSPLGALVINRELISSPIYDRTAFFLDEQNNPYIDNVFVSSFFVAQNGVRYKITGINQGRGEKDTIMYTPAWGKRTGTNQDGIEVVVSNSTVTSINISNSEIPDEGYVLSVSGPQLEAFSESVKVGDRIVSSIRVVPYATSPYQISNLISGGPRLLKHGQIYVSKHEEKFKLDIAKGRAARTAIGITPDGKVLLVTVDGRPRRKKLRDKNDVSIGATLEELSNLMLSLGAVEAMNLDGGSSSTMVIKGEVVNYPSSGFERRVSNAIVVLPKP